MIELTVNNRFLKWLETEDGVDCSDIFTLESARSQDDFEKYLRNRLRTAYFAGVQAALDELSDTALEQQESG